MEGIELSIGQQASLAVFKQQIQDLTRDEALDLLYHLRKQMIVKDVLVKQLLREDLGARLNEI